MVATGGKLCCSGHSANAFAVRNSGPHTVIEGAGDTAVNNDGGMVTVLGTTGLSTLVRV